jgi:hypothetical protein
MSAFLVCFVRVILGSIISALPGMVLVWLAVRPRAYVSEPLEGFGELLLGVLLSILGLVGGAIAAAILWARRKQGGSRIAVAALFVYFSILVCSLLLGWMILRSASGPPSGNGRGFWGDL